MAFKKNLINYNPLDEGLMNELGQKLGFPMWYYRDENKTYSTPGMRDGEDLKIDDYFEPKFSLYHGNSLVNFFMCGHQYSPPLCTFNLNTLRSTKNSQYQVKLKKEDIDWLKQKLKKYEDKNY